MNKNCKKILVSNILISLVLTTAITAGAVKADAGKVTRLGALDRYSTSAQVAISNWNNGSNNVVLVAGEGYADAISASSLAKTLDAPILLTKSNILSSDTQSALNTLKPKNIYIVGGTASVSQSIRNTLKKSYDLVELGGKTRYETNVAVANELVNNHGVSADNVMVVGGQNFSDALSIAPIAAVKGEILLLADNNSNDISQQLNFIKANKSKATIIGTSNVINDNIYSKFSAINRVDGGSDRFDTNLKILNYYKSDLKNDKMYIANATGNGYADALVASVLSGKYTAPLVLTDKENTQNTDNAISYITKNIDGNKTIVNIVGGTAVVPDTIVNIINININKSQQNDNSNGNTDSSSGNTNNSGSNDVKVSSISLNKSTDTLTVGDTDNLIATISPTNATNKNVTWDSSNKEIATVDSNGKVTAVSTGKVTITATTNDGSKKASCLITINAGDAEDLPFEIVGQTDKDYFSLDDVGLTSWVSNYIEKFNNGLALVYAKDPNSDFKLNNQIEDIQQNGKDYRNDFKAGFINSTGKEVISPKYDTAYNFSDGLAVVELNGKWGAVDETGKEIIPLKYNWMSDFSDGLAPVELNGKYGFVNNKGEEVISPKYDTAYGFSDGLALVGLNGRWGFVNNKGEEVVSLKYDNATIFSEGLAQVELDGKWALIDKTGVLITGFSNYDNLSNSSPLWSNGEIAVTTVGGVINMNTGKEILVPSHTKNGSDGTYVQASCGSGYESNNELVNEGLITIKNDGVWSYIDKNGNEIISDLKYYNAYGFSEERALVSIEGNEINNKYGYIDKTGKEVIPVKYEHAYPFSNGLAKVELNGRWGYIDKTGNEIVPIKYDSVSDFSEGLAKVELNGKYGYVDNKGKELLPLKYSNLTDFSEGLAAIKTNDKWQIIKMKK